MVSHAWQGELIGPLPGDKRRAESLGIVMSAEIRKSVAARLEPPALSHQASFIAALREGFHRGIQPVCTPERIREIDADFAGYLREITSQTGMITLPTGEVVPRVPHSVHWLVEGDTFIGEVSIRHRLNDYLKYAGGHIGDGITPSLRRQGYGRLILALAIEECRLLGIDKVLVTSLTANIASTRIIEANGGELENVIDDPDGRGPLRRYWIAL
jgi:predicted acetyltransferase